MRLKGKLSLCRHKPVHATHKHLKWFMGTSVFSTFPMYEFSFFYFLFCTKKHKSANKQISYFFPLKCFFSTFFIFVCLLVFFVFASLCFCSFWCFLCVQNLFVKIKNKKFKITTKFILLQEWIFFNYHNFFQL